VRTILIRALRRARRRGADRERAADRRTTNHISCARRIAVNLLTTAFGILPGLVAATIAIFMYLAFFIG
jgi:hypothetical protein